MYTYRPDQITYEYTPESKDNMGDWRNGYTLHKDTYISNTEKNGLQIITNLLSKMEHRPK